jgi:hypothetical protein
MGFDFVTVFLLLAMLHEFPQLLGSAEDGEGIAGVKRRRVFRMYL